MSRLSKNNLKRGLSYLKRNGIENSVYKALERLKRDEDEAGYTEKVLKQRLSEDELRIIRGRKYRNPVKISILVPLYETDPKLLIKTLECVARQTYGNWELCLGDASSSDDRRSIVNDFIRSWDKEASNVYGSIRDKIRYKYLGENKGISGNTNAVLEMATGDYIALLDHDDVIEPEVLSEYMKEIEYRSISQDGGLRKLNKVLVCYCDEDKVSSDDSKYFDWHRKPDFDELLLLTNNYVCHFLMVDISLARSVGGFNPAFDGAQDHDFILKITEGLKDEEIVHIPKAMYHWRSTLSSTSENPDAKLYAYEAGKRAVEASLKRRGIKARVTDTAHLGFYRFDIENGIESSNIKCFNTEEWNALDLPAIRNIEEEYIFIKADNLKAIDKDFLKTMTALFVFENVGAVTGKIIGKNNRIESAGYDKIDIGIKPRFEGLFSKYSGYLHRASLQQYVDAAAPDLVMVRKSALDENDIHGGSCGIGLKKGMKTAYEPKAAFVRQ